MSQSKPIAVICSDIAATFQWLKTNFDVDRIQAASRIASCSKDGKIYILILTAEQSYGWEFSDMIISPNYYSLEKIVKSRIR